MQRSRKTTFHTTKKTSASESIVPPIVMARHVLRQILSSVGALPAETGGILLGPVGTDEVTGFFFDSTAGCTGVTYSPDHVSLRKKLKEDWMPYGLDMKGFVHSHPGSLDRLSGGDVTYIARLLEINPDMNVFIAPVVIPHQFQLAPIVVLRAQPRVPRPTVLRLM